MRTRSLLRLAKRLVVVLILAALAAGVGLRWLLRASLARTQGQVVLAGLSAAVEVARDERGVPVITAQSLADVFLAQGFVHAQERYFQMDLTRRAAAGELAALLGSELLVHDRRARALRLRSVASELLARLSSAQRELLERYTSGVNAGLADLGARPPEYLLLAAEPEPWSATDSLLVAFAIHRMQSLNALFEAPLGVMRAVLPAELYELLTPETTRFDRPTMRAEDGDPTGGYAPLALPGADVVDLRTRAPAAARVEHPFETAPGSNAWVVSGALSAHGGAILANDPHLSFSVPTIWFRNELHWEGGRAMGVVLPGVPGIGIGSNGHLAWGFTNAMIDQEDLIVVEVDPDDPSRYRTPEGFEAFGAAQERLGVRGGEAETLALAVTRWGVVTGRDWQGRPIVLRWPALDAATVNLDVMQMLSATTIEQALAILRGWWGAGFNAMIADSAGRIAWSVTGWLPQRSGIDGKAPSAWTSAGDGWPAALADDQRPQVLDPKDGVLFSANQRVAPLALARPVSRVWLAPDRAHRIAELLAAPGPKDEAALARMQLDTRSSVHELYGDLVLELARAHQGDALLARAAELVRGWDGSAECDQAGFRILRHFRLALHAGLLGPLLAPCADAAPDFVYTWPLMEEPVRRILEERPAHLVPPPYASFDACLHAILLATLRAIEADPAAPGLARPWGEVNRALVLHPFSRVSPLLGRWLDMPRDPLPGHTTTVRAADPSFGQSLRMVVSPGREEQGFLTLPCGQSGHFLSPHYGDGHADWLHGRTRPFLAGEARTRFRLLPAGS